MKKLLALVLARVMTLGLATVGANAALKDYSDASDIKYEEAFAVMNAVGVFQGSDGKLTPKANLTRAQAAKIIAYLNIGETAAEALTKDVSTFSDVAAGSWAAGYISYCYNTGIVGGKGDNKYDPDANVTALEFAKMLLVTLGYDAKREGLVGADYSINTAKLAATNNLFSGNNAIAINSAATREEAALYAFNALKAECVSYATAAVTVEGGDGTKVTVGGSGAAPYAGANSAAINSEVADGTATVNHVQLGEKLYNGDLTRTTPGTADKFGNPASRDWDYKTKDVYTTIRTPFFTTHEAMSGSAVLAALQGYSVNVYAATGATSATATKVTSDLALTGTLTLKNVIVNNGATTANYTPASATALVDLIAAMTADGKKVEFYANSSNIIDKIVITAYDFSKLSTITSNKTQTTYTFADTTAKIIYTEEAKQGDNTIEFVGCTPTKGDYYTYALTASGKVYAYPVTTVTGTASKVINESAPVRQKVVVDGTTYITARGNADWSAFAVTGNEGIYYLDQFGMPVDTTATAPKTYALITNATASYTKGLDAKTPNITVRAVLGDGTVGTYTLATTTQSTSTTSATAASAGTLSGITTEANKDLVIKGITDGTGKYFIVYDDSKYQTELGGGAADTVNTDAQLLGAVKDAVLNQVFAYTISGTTITLANVTTASGAMASETVYQIPTSTEDVAKGTISYTGGGATGLATANTTYVVYRTDKKTATVYTGASNLPTSLAGMTVKGDVVLTSNTTTTTTATGVANVIFVQVGGAVAADRDSWVYIDPSQYVVTKVGDTNKYTYTGIAQDGSEVELAPSSKIADEANEGIFLYDKDKVVGTTALAVEGTADGTKTGTAGGAAANLYVYCSNAALNADGSVVSLGAAGYFNIVDGLTQIHNLSATKTTVTGKVLVALEADSTGLAASGNVLAIYIID